MSTITPTRKRTMRCRNRSASIVKFTPAPSERGAQRASATRHRASPLDPHVPWRERVQGAAQPGDIGGPALARREADALADRVNPRIGPASADGRRPPAHQALEHGFELPLYRAPFPLPLPAHEPRPIVVHHGEVGPAGHGRKIEKTGGSIKPRNPLSHLTKDDF